MKKIIKWVITLLIISPFSLNIYACHPSTIDDNSEVPSDYQQPDLNPNPKENNENIKFYMVSTGNGLASFIKLKKSNSAIIFDTGIGGPPLTWKQKLYQKNETLLKVLKQAGVTSIDAIFLSHFHTDHYSNLRTIIANFPVKRIIPNISYDKWIKEFGSDFKKHEINITQGIKKNYLIDNIIFEDWSYSAKNWMENLTEKGNNNENNKSNIISFQYYGKRFLITGDADKELASQIVNHANYLKPIDFYQVPHHGSNNAAGNDFLKIIKPKYFYIPGTSTKDEQDPWAKFIGQKTHQFPKATVIDQLKNYSNDIRMTGEKPNIANANLITVAEKTLIFSVNNLGTVTETTEDTTVLNSSS